MSNVKFHLEEVDFILFPCHYSIILYNESICISLLDFEEYYRNIIG